MTPNTAPATQPESTPAPELRAELPFDFTAFVSASVVMAPVYVESARAAEQLPVLFWLCEAVSPRTIVDIGAVDATAYFGLCQAADQLSLDTACYLGGVALEQDDAESQAKLPQWIEHQNDHHGNRSQIVGGNHGNLAEMLKKGSLDLLVLHAEGASIDQVRQWKADFLPKLSTHSAVFIDGLGNGSHELFDELAAMGPSFRFNHGTGFGVVAPGKSPPELIRYLEAQARDEKTAAAVSSLFQRLGLGCRQAADLARFEQVRGQLRSAADELSAAREHSGLQAARLVSREAEIFELRDRLDWHREELEGAQHKNIGSQTEINRLRDTVKSHQDQAQKAGEELQKSREAATRQEQTSAELKAAQGQAESIRETHIAEIAELTRICEGWRTKVASLDSQLGAAYDNIRRQRRVRHQVSAELKGRIRKLQEDLRQAQDGAASWQKQVDDLLNSTSWRLTRPIRGLKGALTRSNDRD